MKKAAAWFAGYKDLEKGFDSTALSFRNQKHSAFRFLVGVLFVFAIGYAVCTIRGG